MPINFLNGIRLKNAVVAGAQRVIQMQEQLNNINVFPVADGDTGTNMALTMRSIADGALNNHDDSVHAMSRIVADSALMGARGNSGAILAQFFQGLAEGFDGRRRATLQEVGRAVERAAVCAREAIADPQEGTILTVIHDWAQAVKNYLERAADFADLFKQSLQAATQSLQDTPKKLKILSKSGVVDAGAQGFVHMLEGVQHFLEAGKVERLAGAATFFGNKRAKVEDAPEDITFQFCTEALIVGEEIDRGALRERLRPLGNSMIVAGSDRRVKVHIHTNDPQEIFRIASSYGSLQNTKADDMRQQHKRVHGKNGALKTVALITDSSCDLPGDEFIRRHIHVVPVVVNFGEESFVDKVTMTDKDFYKMLVTSRHHPKTSQPAPADFQEIFKQAAESFQQGLAIILSGGLSGTLQAAQTAARMMQQQFKVEVIDSRAVTIALAIIVREAATAIERGDSIEDVKRRVQWAVENTRLFVSVETMEYLVRGGRVSRFRGVAARLLNLKPILTLTPEGKAEVVAKTIGGVPARKKMIDLVCKAARGKKNLRFMVGHADAIETAGFYAAQIRRHFEVLDVPIVSVSPALGAHAGPGAAAIAFLGE
jgi:hypothetical protein